MRLVSIYNCREGMILAKSISNDRGRILLNSGMTLTDGMIKRLKQLNVEIIYVRDKVTEDLIIGDDISEEVRQEAVETIQSHFERIADTHSNKRSFLHNDKMLKDFQSTFKKLLNELHRQKSSINLLTYVCAKDTHLYTHSVNVTLYTLAMAMRSGFNEKKIHEIGMGGLLHDIGKMLIPREILDKPGKLTDLEFDIIKEHTSLGFNVLRKEYEISLLSAHCAYQHHEKVDGTGYPRGLKGEEIHPFARMMAVADVFDALTTHRVYRRAMLPHEGMEYLFAGTGSHFDPAMVELFRTTVAIYPVGITVKLSTGETGVVIDYKADLPHRPIVRVFKDEEGYDLKDYKEVDLSKNLTIFITECDAII